MDLHHFIPDCIYRDWIGSISILPGDSLLFAAGALSVLDGSILHIVPLIITLWLAAVLGDTVNYHIGKRLEHPYQKIAGLEN